MYILLLVLLVVHSDAILILHAVQVCSCCDSYSGCGTVYKALGISESTLLRLDELDDNKSFLTLGMQYIFKKIYTTQKINHSIKPSLLNLTGPSVLLGRTSDCESVSPALEQMKVSTGGLEKQEQDKPLKRKGFIRCWPQTIALFLSFMLDQPVISIFYFDFLCDI